MFYLLFYSQIHAVLPPFFEDWKLKLFTTCIYLTRTYVLLSSFFAFIPYLQRKGYSAFFLIKKSRWICVFYIYYWRKENCSFVCYKYSIQHFFQKQNLTSSKIFVEILPIFRPDFEERNDPWIAIVFGKTFWSLFLLRPKLYSFAKKKQTHLLFFDI